MSRPACQEAQPKYQKTAVNYQKRSLGNVTYHRRVKCPGPPTCIPNGTKCIVCQLKQQQQRD